MIRVYKDRDTKLITKGAYENFYKPLGYKIVIEEKKIVEKESKDKKETIKTETKTRSNKENKELEETKKQEENKELEEAKKQEEHKDFDESEDLE